MSAGLPGLGLGGLFFIFSALLAPLRQLCRTFTGRSRAGDWAMIGRQFAQAMVMVAAIDLALRLAYLGIAAAGLANTPSAVSATVIPLTLIGITSALLVGVLATAKFADIAVRLRPAELPRVPDVLPRATPLRTLTLSGVVAVAWLALLVAGASQLSPLTRPRGEGATTQRNHDAPDPKPSLARSARQPQTGALSAPAPASPRPSDAASPLPAPGHEPNGSEAGVAVQPAVSAPAPPPGPAPIHEEQTPPAAPPAGAPSPPPVSVGSELPPVANPPHATGPPPSAGPPEGSPAPEHAGPPERSPPPRTPAAP